MNKTAIVIGYKPNEVTTLLAKEITEDYTLNDFQNDRIRTIETNKDYQNFETRLI